MLDSCWEEENQTWGKSFEFCRNLKSQVVWIQKTSKKHQKPIQDLPVGL